MKYQYILFDLDGTIINSSRGVTKSIQYALSKVGIEENDTNNLTRFIGPPLAHSFRTFYAMDESKIDEAVKHFRENYSTECLLENDLYEGIEYVIKTLNESGISVGIATAKPTVYAQEIVEHLQLDRYIDTLVGSSLDDSHHDKADIIKSAIKNLNAEEDANILMIGDRLYDIAGARKSNADTIAVLYGFGSKEELESEDPTYIVSKPMEILDIVLDDKAS